MASDSIEPSLANLFNQMQIGASDKKLVHGTFGIKSLQELLKKRFRLSKAARKEKIFNGARLVAAISYMLMRKKSNIQQPIHQLFTSSNSLKDSFEYFLANKALTGIVKKRKAKQAKSQAPAKPRDKEADVKWVKDYDWKFDAAVISDADSDDENDPEALRRTLGIDSEASPWHLDAKTWRVVLKNLPDEFQVPLSLFKKLYPHQRVGLQWMVGLYLEGSGGILVRVVMRFCCGTLADEFDLFNDLES